MDSARTKRNWPVEPRSILSSTIDFWSEVQLRDMGKQLFEWLLCKLVYVVLLRGFISSFPKWFVVVSPDKRQFKIYGD
ncbi:hypothetical protein TNCT_117481 [Trichonephila clavata]|uniref:Uncharacterized protein n=1 Tax=Trichonephila clavata TaxID=2740835 RepID=A0A8X6FQC6_TRICU|nr:hypothetical protein TNCT_117481 [Trichonephila clavata]